MAVEKPDDLYGLPLDSFVPERGALARALRDRGKRDEAARVAKLRKPSVAAWAINQLVRTQQREVGKLFEAGDATQKAQAELLAGRGDAGDLRDGARRERAAAETLLEAAKGLLSSNGHELSATTLERVSDTLHAAALDPQARDQLKDGQLERELRHIGIALGAVSATDATVAPRPKAPARAAPPPKADAAHRAARVAEGNARRAMERAERALEVAEERRIRADQALRAAGDAALRARERARAAAEEHRRFLDELERKSGR